MKFHNFFRNTNGIFAFNYLFVFSTVRIFHGSKLTRFLLYMSLNMESSGQLKLLSYLIWNIYIYKYIYIYMTPFQTETESEAQAIFQNPFTVCTSCKRKFVFCPFVCEKINRVIRWQTD
jgi:hypothetical protein